MNKNILQIAESLDSSANEDSIMNYRVKPHVKEIKGLIILINIVDRLNSSEEVIIIKETLLEMREHPELHTCLSQKDKNNIFIPKNENWANEDDGHAYGAIKPVFNLIKKLMFEDDDSDCTEIEGADHF